MEILYPTASVFMFTLIGLMFFSFFLIICWIAIRLICWPLQVMWYAIKNLIDNT